MSNANPIGELLTTDRTEQGVFSARTTAKRWRCRGNDRDRFFSFLGELTYLLIRAAALGQGRRWSNLWAQMDRVGVKSIPIVCLVLFCIGAILSLQMAPMLARVRRGG
jgi:ABC-type transporter Mla maintaining outer membrane lipid asymmetry permease subunit MlaE